MAYYFVYVVNSISCIGIYTISKSMLWPAYIGVVWFMVPQPG